ncbi:MAG: hypothetical protein ACRDR6_08455 [Pseudonocardiaceae bacterium]
MTARTRRSKNRAAKSGQGRLGDEGAERYMWVFPEGHHIVLTIPGLRDLELNVDDAKADFDEWFQQGLYLVGEIAPVTEYQSQEDRARNRPVRPRIDEVTGLPLCRGTPSRTPRRTRTVTSRSLSP